MSRIPAAEWEAAKRKQTPDERAKLCRWLGIDPAHPQAWYAVLPFVRMETSDGPRIAALMPPELPLWAAGPVGVHDGADVVLIAPDGAVGMHRDAGAHLVGTLTDGPLYICGKAFARDWAAARLLFWARMQESMRVYHVRMTEDASGQAPGTLLVGNPKRIRWPEGVTFTAPDEGTAKIINIAIWQAARLSKAVAPEQRKSA